MTNAPGLGIGVDIGGTKVAAGLARGGELLEVREAPTPMDSTSIIDVVVDLVEALQPTGRVVPVGVAAAGFLDFARRSVTFAPNLPWRNEPLQSELASRLQVPVVIENDANAAAWAEYRFGAAVGAQSMAMITVGTGIGGGVVTHGRLLIGGHGVAAELGHIQVVSDHGTLDGEPPRLCGCGSRGCWEMYGSGTALGAAARALAETEAGASLRDRVDGDLEKLSGSVVTDAALDGNAAALGLLADLGEWLGHGLASISAVLDPEVIVVGGGVAEAGAAVLDPLGEAYRAAMRRSHRPPGDLRPAALGNSAGMLGAADLACERDDG